MVFAQCCARITKIHEFPHGAPSCGAVVHIIVICVALPWRPGSHSRQAAADKVSTHPAPEAEKEHPRERRRPFGHWPRYNVLGLGGQGPAPGSDVGKAGRGKLDLACGALEID